jgi:hypothetical protein
VAVRAKTEMDKVEHRRRPGYLPEILGILRGCGLEIRRFYRHGIDLLRAQRGTLKEAFAQVGKVPIRVSVGGHALVDLIYVHTFPRDIFPRQRPQHDPGSVTSTNSQGEAATGSHRGPSIRSDSRRSRSGDGIGIVKHFEFHGAFSR